jgi:putative ABC transport system permease protein
MNIMMVRVTELTRENDITKAICATNRQILSQFLIEALAMTITGGVIGMGLGYAIAYAVSTYFGFLPGFQWYIFALAIGVSLVVGLLFGAWPAVKAARKDPIEALRYFQ